MADERTPDLETLQLAIARDPRSAGLIATNVTRTRVTVLGFNLTIIVVMTSQLGSPDMTAAAIVAGHMTTYVSLFAGFCFTVLGLVWLIASQNSDVLGLSRPLPFTLGKITTYLAVSQSISAFMHEYLVGIRSALDDPAVDPQDLFSESPMLVLFVLAGVTWVVVTYAGPLYAALRAPKGDRRALLCTGYYFALQLPIFWAYMQAYAIERAIADEAAHSGKLFLLQFVQPVLWL